jgi:hypothetical protein
MTTRKWYEIGNMFWMFIFCQCLCNICSYKARTVLGIDGDGWFMLALVLEIAAMYFFLCPLVEKKSNTFQSIDDKYANKR